ncbi:DUF6456 domain-containing protein [Celeribacter arenosi]|uniref:DUF6456 domain-containing protein n=1 Tax=Celeribacter arenosi TaxID=792649 RepID=A0ABP7KH71_9RHOB
MFETAKSQVGLGEDLPNWVPQEAKRYIAHTESGQTIRALARKSGCAPSTVMRQVRRIEQKRDDPLIDEALSVLSRVAIGTPAAVGDEARKETLPMTDDSLFLAHEPLDDVTVEREARRILRRLSEPGACLAVAQDMEKAVVVRDLPDGRTTRTAVLDRPVAQAMALKEWISAKAKGKITRYTITAAGRAALKRFLAADETTQGGFAEAPARFYDAESEVVSRVEPVGGDEGARRLRYNAAESPVQVLSRRRDKDGTMFLSPELVAAAERLREDFELAQMGPRVTQNWERFLTGTARGTFSGDAKGFGPEAAQARVASALDDLGPGLADVALRCCCYLEGMEQAEQRMGWSARSGKIVLRIALQRLKRHYDDAGYSNLIG